MSVNIDELRRLEKAATKGPWDSGDFTSEIPEPDDLWLPIPRKDGAK
jgi:hypothetical protein